MLDVRTNTGRYYIYIYTHRREGTMQKMFLNKLMKKQVVYNTVKCQNKFRFLLNNYKNYKNCNNNINNSSITAFFTSFSTDSSDDNNNNNNDKNRKNYKRNINRRGRDGGRKSAGGRLNKKQLSMVYEPHTGLDLYNHPNIKRDLDLMWEDDEEEVDIDAIDDSEVIDNPFDLTKMRRNYVAFVGPLPSSANGETEENLKSFFGELDIIHITTVPGRNLYLKKDGTQVKSNDFAFVYFADAGSLREAIHEFNGENYKGQTLRIELSDRHYQNRDGEGQTAVSGGDLFYDEEGRLYVNTRNKMKQINKVTREEQAHFFPETLDDNQSVGTECIDNLPGKPGKENVDVKEMMDALYTTGEKILAQHKDESSFLTTQERNLFGVSHHWNPTLRVDGQNDDEKQAKRLRDMEVTLGLTASHDSNEDGEEIIGSAKDEQEEKDKDSEFDESKAYLNADVGTVTREQQHLQRLEDFSSIVLSTGRVSVTRKAGRDMSYRCLVVAGDCMGRGGFGFGKGASMPKARDQALKDAVKNMIYIPLYEGRTLYHDLKGKHNNAKVILRARPAGSGLVAGPAVRSILDVIGIRDCTTKVFGRQNIYSTVQAVFKAFNSYEDAESIARKRGKRLIDVNEVMRGNHQSIW